MRHMKVRASDLSSWAKGRIKASEKRQAGRFGHAAAIRTVTIPKGPGTEYNKLKKYFERME